MRRIDALQAHRAGVLALLRRLPADPPTALLLALATRRSMRWMLEAAGVPTRGVRGELRVKGLVAVWLWTVRAWRDRRHRGPVGHHGGARRGAAPRRAGGPDGWAGARAQAEAAARTPTRRNRRRKHRTPRLEPRCAAAYQERAAGGAVMATRSVATVFGGSGFIGRYIVKRLAHKGFVVRVAVRDPEAALFLKPMGAVGQVVPLYASLTNETDGAPRGGRRGPRRQHGGHPGGAASRATSSASTPRGPGWSARLAAQRRRRAPGAHLGDRRRSRMPPAATPRPRASARPCCARRSPRRRSCARRWCSARRTQLFNRFAGDGAAAAGHAGDLRRYAIPAGLCRRRGRCGDGGVGARGRSGRGL